MAPPEARPEGYGGYSSTFNSYDSAESTIVVNTGNLHAASRKKRRRLTQSASEDEGSHTPEKESEPKSNTMSPAKEPMKINQDEVWDWMDDGQIRVFGQKHDGHSPTDSDLHPTGHGGEPYWSANTSAIQGLVGMMDKAGREEQQQRIAAEKKLAVTEHNLASTRLDLADERVAHIDTKAKIIELRLKLDEYEKTQENCDREHAKRQAELEKKNEELQRQYETAVKERDSERRAVESFQATVNEQHQKLDTATEVSQAQKEQITDLQSKSMKQEELLGESRLQIGILRGQIDDYEKRLDSITKIIKPK